MVLHQLQQLFDSQTIETTILSPYYNKKIKEKKEKKEEEKRKEASLFFLSDRSNYNIEKYYNYYLIIIL
jgi:hypothetical protein